MGHVRAKVLPNHLDTVSWKNTVPICYTGFIQVITRMFHTRD